MKLVLVNDLLRLPCGEAASTPGTTVRSRIKTIDIAIIAIEETAPVERTFKPMTVH